MKRKGDSAVGAARHVAAITAKDELGVSPAVKKEGRRAGPGAQLSAPVLEIVAQGRSRRKADQDLPLFRALADDANFAGANLLIYTKKLLNEDNLL